jgi:hypothetical protein
MLSRLVKVTDLNQDHWRHLTELTYFHRFDRKLFLLHEAGKPLKLWESQAGDLPLPSESVGDPQSYAESLLKAYPEMAEVRVVDPEAFAQKMAEVQSKANFDMELDDYALMEFEECLKAPGFAIAPKREFLWHSLPWKRLQRFAAKLLPASCTFVLGVFDGDALWASLLAQFENGKIVAISTTDALPPEDVKDFVGRDQHPFFLSCVANAFQRPAFGWFVEKAVFEFWLKAMDEDEKDEIFQKAIIENKATFDFNILIDRGVTALSPVNPGEMAVVGQDRESNPRTRTPDPSDPGPSAY